MHDEVQPVSYHLNLFQCLAHDALNSPEDQELLKFVIDSLDFLMIEEARRLPKIFLQQYTQIEPLLALLYKQASSLSLP